MPHEASPMIEETTVPITYFMCIAGQSTRAPILELKCVMYKLAFVAAT